MHLISLLVHASMIVALAASTSAGAPLCFDSGSPHQKAGAGNRWGFIKHIRGTARKII